MRFAQNPEVRVRTILGHFRPIRVRMLIYGSFRQVGVRMTDLASENPSQNRQKIKFRFPSTARLLAMQHTHKGCTILEENDVQSNWIDLTSFYSSPSSSICFLCANSFIAFVNLLWPDRKVSNIWWSAVPSSKLVHRTGIWGFDVIKVRKEIGRSNANCFVKKVEVASGMTRNSRPYMCSNSCTPMFETAAMVEESVTAPCLTFFPAVLEYNAITKQPWIHN